MTTYTFDRETLRSTKRVPCSICGRTVERSRTDWVSSNPFNGYPTVAEMRAKLREREAEWKARPETHQKCEGNR